MSIIIRKMCDDDVDAAMAILREWNMAPVAASADIQDPERSELNVDNSFVALRDGEIVGVCSYIIHAPHLAETASLAVSAGCRGLGVGDQLQRARLLELKRLGIKTLHTETDREDTVAWYIRKFGYRKVGTNPKKHSFSLTDVDEWMILELDLDEWSPTSHEVSP
jgi:N-acetylglutamate synthase-like GNAT family acetyltransferase